MRARSRIGAQLFDFRDCALNQYPIKYLTEAVGLLAWLFSYHFNFNKLQTKHSTFSHSFQICSSPSCLWVTHFFVSNRISGLSFSFYPFCLNDSFSFYIIYCMFYIWKFPFDLEHSYVACSITFPRYFIVISVSGVTIFSEVPHYLPSSIVIFIFSCLAFSTELWVSQGKWPC